MGAEAWRFMDLDLVPLERLHAIEEAIAGSRSEPTLLLWRADRPVITLGYFQRAEEELNLTNCRRLGIKTVRRITGGGAILIGPDTLAYSIIVDERNPLVPADIAMSYEFVCGGLVKGLEMLGVDAKFVPINDVQVSNKKLSGSAQTRVWGKLIQHGFLNLNLDLETLVNVLNVPKEKLKDKGVRSLEERVTWVNGELAKMGKPAATMRELKACLKDGFREALGIGLVDGKLSAAEERRAKTALRRFLMDDWNLRPSLFETANARAIYKAKKGVIRVSSYIQEGRIEDILVTGDFFVYPEEAFLGLGKALASVSAEERSIAASVKKFFGVNKLVTVGITPEDFVKAIGQAIASSVSQAGQPEALSGKG